MAETRNFNYPVNFNSGASLYGSELVGGLFAGRGKVFFVDPANGSDTANSGRQPRNAYATLYKAHSAMTAGQNDICVLLGDGAATATARLSLALAVSVDSAATTGTLTWSKNACHLVGLTAPTRNWQRARIAPPSGTYTASTFGSGTFINITGNGCIFSNFSIFHGFSTGGTSQITVKLTAGQRNYFENVHFGGLADAEAAADTASASVQLAGSSENTFKNCTFGLDTVNQTAATQQVLITSASARNFFEGCTWQSRLTGSGTAHLSVYASGANSLDRNTYFRDCIFASSIGSSGSTQAAVAKITAASNGMFIMKDCMRVGVTDWGEDATSLAQIYVLGAAGVSATAGNVGDDIGRAMVAIAS